MEKKIIQKAGRYFTIPERHELIKEYLSSGCTKEAIWEKYTGQSEHGTLLKWMRDLGYCTSGNPKNVTIASNTEEMPKKELEKRIAELEKQLKEAELKAIAFSTMVDIAEKEFKIPIRKKYNTKP